jgi:N-acetylmuramoyl-L-alanine amidase
MNALIGIAVLATQTWSASNRVDVHVNGQSVGEHAVIRNGRVLVPMRIIAESLGSRVHYYPERRRVVITKGADVATFALTKGPAYTLLGDRVRTSARMIDGRVMVPLRFVAEHFDASVSWDRQTRTAHVTTAGSDGGSA